MIIAVLCAKLKKIGKYYILLQTDIERKKMKRYFLDNK